MGDRNDFAIESSGEFFLREGGNITFVVNSDDGFVLEIDGGISPDTAPLARSAGADILVAGSAVFRAPDYAAMIATLRGANGSGA